MFSTVHPPRIILVSFTVHKIADWVPSLPMVNTDEYYLSGIDKPRTTCWKIHSRNTTSVNSVKFMAKKLTCTSNFDFRTPACQCSFTSSWHGVWNLQVCASSKQKWNITLSWHSTSPSHETCSSFHLFSMKIGGPELSCDSWMKIMLKSKHSDASKLKGWLKPKALNWIPWKLWG